MEINEREKHPVIKCTSYSRGQVRFERDLCFMIMLTTQSFSFTACSYPKVVLPMSILLQYTSYVTYTHIYLIRLFQKVPRGQAVVEPPFKVRLFPSLKIANARMEKKYIHGPMQGSMLHIQSRFKKASSSSENFSSLIWVALLYSLLQFWSNLMRICLASLIQVNSGLQYLVY